MQAGTTHYQRKDYILANELARASLLKQKNVN